MLLEHRFSVPQIADMFGVSVSTIRRQMSDYGLSVGATYADLDDNELDRLVREIQHLFLDYCHFFSIIVSIVNVNNPTTETINAATYHKSPPLWKAILIMSIQHNNTNE